MKENGWDSPELIYEVSHHRSLCDSIIQLYNDFETIANIEKKYISGLHGDIPIYIYTPHGKGPFPVILHFPTGGFVGGGPGSAGGLCQNLASRSNSVVILVDFHKAPEYKYPAAPNDAYTVLEWVAKHGNKLNIDSNKIAVSGDSAGANLAALTCVRSRNENGPKILLQLLLVPYIDLAMSTDSVKNIRTLPANSYPYLEWINRLYLPANVDPMDPKVSPFWETELKNLPKAVIVTTGHDSHLDQGRIYAEKLKNAGNEVIYKNYPGMIHIFLNMEDILPEAKEANFELALEIKKAFMN